MLRIESKLEPQVEVWVTESLDTGYTVYRELGPGFRELIYNRAYCLELSKRGIPFEAVLIEIKAVPRLRLIHRAQALSYLKTLNLKVALVMNFGGATFKGNVKRVVL